jgi:hypothetical protein
MFLRAIVPVASIAALLVIGRQDLSAQSESRDSTVDRAQPALSAEAPGRLTRVDDVPPGTNWVADARTRTYYRAGCPASANIQQSDRLYYATDSILQAEGYTKNECSSSYPRAEAPVRAATPTLALASTPKPFPPDAPATQDTRSRKGFWFSAGLGFGSLGCQDCTGREGSYSGGLALGGTLSQKVIIGVGTNGWYKSVNGVTLSAGTLTALIRFYPSYTGGFFLLGGIGVGSIHTQVAGFGSATETGGGVLLGLGYDIRVGNNVSLTPYWNGFAVRTSNSDANVGQIGLGITFN